MIQLSCQPNAPLPYPCSEQSGPDPKLIGIGLYGFALCLFGFFGDKSPLAIPLHYSLAHLLVGGGILGTSLAKTKKVWVAQKKARICADSVLKELFHTHGICARTDSIRERWARMETPSGRKEQVMAICGLTGPESFGGARTSNSTTTYSSNEMNLALSLLSQRLKRCAQ